MPTQIEFAAKIRQKYPQYQDIDDSTLVAKIVEKYPVYKSQISDFGQPPIIAEETSPPLEMPEQITQPDPIRDILSPETAKVYDGIKQNQLGAAKPTRPTPLSSTIASFKRLGEMKKSGELDIFTDKLRKELEDKPLASEFLTGLFGERANIGQQLPEAKTTGEKVARGAAGLAGTIIGFAPIAKAVGFVGIGGRLVGKYRLLGRLIGSAETFIAHGQIMKKGTNYTERLKQAGQDLTTGLVFGVAGSLGKEILKGTAGQLVSYPTMFGIGFGMSKMGDSSNEDAIINGALLVALHGLFDIGGAKGRKAESEKFIVEKLREQGIENPESVAKEAIKQAEEFKNLNPEEYDKLFGKPEAKIEKPKTEPTAKVEPEPVIEKPTRLAVGQEEPKKEEVKPKVEKPVEKEVVEPIQPVEGRKATEPKIEKPEKQPKETVKPKEAPIVPKEEEKPVEAKPPTKKPIVEAKKIGKSTYTEKNGKIFKTYRGNTFEISQSEYNKALERSNITKRGNITKGRNIVLAEERFIKQGDMPATEAMRGIDLGKDYDMSEYRIGDSPDFAQKMFKHEKANYDEIESAALDPVVAKYGYDAVYDRDGNIDVDKVLNLVDREFLEASEGKFKEPPKIRIKEESFVLDESEYKKELKSAEQYLESTKEELNVAKKKGNDIKDIEVNIKWTEGEIKEIKEFLKEREDYTEKVQYANNRFKKPQKAEGTEAIKMELEPKIAEKINKTEIMTGAEKTFGVTLKSKATHRWKNAGAYYPKEQIIRMEKWGELSTLAHEVAHHVDNVLQKSIGQVWKTPNREILKELKSLDYDQNKKRVNEGFAEYLRYKITTETAHEKAPKFDKYFNTVLDKNPNIKSKIDGLKDKMDIWFKQGAENRIIQHIDWEREHTEIKGIKPKLKKALGFINKKFNDEFYVPQKMVREIEQVIGKKLSPTKNPAIMMEYSKSKAGAIARTFVLDKAIDEYGNVVGPGLVEVLKPIQNKEMKQFISYAVSLRAINLERRNIQSGFDVEDAKFVVEKYKNKGWDKTAQDLTDWSGHILDWAVRSGGLDQETAKLFRDLNPIYLSFKRAFLDEVGIVKGAGGYVDTGGIINGIKGSGRAIINPIESMIAQNRELIAKSQKIRIANLFADIAQEEGIGGFITEVPAPIKATKFNAEQIKGYVEEAGGKIANLDDFLTVFTQDFRYHGKENIVSLWRNGKQKFYEIHPELYESFKGVDALQLGPLLKILGPFARMLRLGATGIKVSFGLARNPFRDAFSYVVFSKRNNVTVFDPIKGIYKDITTKEGEATWRFKKLGGALAGQIGLDRAATQNTYDELLLDKLGKKGKVLKVVKHPINALRDILSITEMGPRSVEIEGSYKRYTSKEWKKSHPEWTEEDAFVQSFIDAQDVTVNFTKSGEWARQINQATAFFNVAIRGPEKVYRSFRERPIQTLVKGGTWLTLLSIGSWYKNKDKDWYKNLPPTYKYNNLFFEIGDNVFRLPIPFELGTVFMSAPQAMLDTYKDKDLKWIMSLKDLAKSQIPNPIPTAFKPVIDIKTNKNYLGVPIESPGMQYLYPTERKRSYTSKFAIETSKGLDKIGVQLSPIQLDYLMDSYSGGFLRQFRIGGEELYSYPILGDLMLRNPDYPRRQLNEFFSDFEYLKQKKQARVATKEELKKLNHISSFYAYYRNKQKAIKKASEQKNNILLKKYYDQLRIGLERKGYK